VKGGGPGGLGEAGLEAAIRHALERQSMSAEIERLGAQLAEDPQGIQPYWSDSHSMHEVMDMVDRVADSTAGVLLRGESGVGKEVIARELHRRSSRRTQQFVKVNCAALPVDLLESELFGHERGAFTGAGNTRVGKFEFANRGTILLDEIGELPLDAQVKLLRVLQEREFEPVGSSRTVRVDVRVIAATNRNLHVAVRQGSFRADLLYRLNVFPIEIPPLRERRSDIPLLAGLFASGLARKLGKPIQGFSVRSMERLTTYAWPGNVRELQNVVERAAILADGPVIDVERAFMDGQTDPTRPIRTAGDTLDDVQRAHIVAVLQSTAGVVEGAKGAAAVLGLHPNTLRSRMKKLGIAPTPRA
jgi:formate hydrogenlyase transcriptional activator